MTVLCCGCFIGVINPIKQIISSLLIMASVGESAHRHLSSVTQLLLSTDGIFRMPFNEVVVRLVCVVRSRVQTYLQNHSGSNRSVPTYVHPKSSS